MNSSFQAQTACSSGCICDQPQNWETEDIFLNFLLEVEISYLKGVERVFAFVKRLLRWAPLLKTITVSFDPSVTVSEELCKKLLTLSSRRTCFKIYLYRDGAKVIYAPVDQDTGR